MRPAVEKDATVAPAGAMHFNGLERRGPGAGAGDVGQRGCRRGGAFQLVLVNLQLVLINAADVSRRSRREAWAGSIEPSAPRRAAG